MLTHSYLREHLHYSIITGKFYWLIPKGGRQFFKEAGNLNPNGYGQIMINYRRYLSHRLAWFWVTGEWPEAIIDHKNRAPNANYWLNLREATYSQNGCNTRKPTTNTSGYKGVTWCKDKKKWKAQIKINQKNKYLGYFLTPELAYVERLKVEKDLFGEFSIPPDVVSSLTYREPEIL